MKQVIEDLKNTIIDLDLKTKIMAGGAILFIVVLIFANACKKKPKDPIIEKNNYVEIKSIMVKAAKEYFNNEENIDYLPLSNFEDEVDVDELVTEGYMKKLSEYVDEGVICEGSVLLRNVEEKYYYNPILDCGDDYYDLTLAEAVMADNEYVTTGHGLYEGEKNIYFKGEVKNNYVKIDGNLWRIVDINKETNEVKLIFDFINYEIPELNSRYKWDDRYNSETTYYDGKNDFDLSRIKDTLTELAKNKKIISKDGLGLLIKRNLCIGARSIDDLTYDNSSECKKLSADLFFFGTFTPSEYIRSSIDPACKSINTEACNNYNFLIPNSGSSWTITPNAANSHSVYAYIEELVSVKANLQQMIYPTVIVHPLALILDGIGTQEKPYVLSK